MWICVILMHFGAFCGRTPGIRSDWGDVAVPGAKPSFCTQKWCYVDPCHLDGCSHRFPTYSNVWQCHSHRLQSVAICRQMLQSVAILVVERCLKFMQSKASAALKHRRKRLLVVGTCQQLAITWLQQMIHSFLTRLFTSMPPCRLTCTASLENLTDFNSMVSIIEHPDMSWWAKLRRGKTVYYSYEACGSNDTFTLGYNKILGRSRRPVDALGVRHRHTHIYIYMVSFLGCRYWTTFRPEF